MTKDCKTSKDLSVFEVVIDFLHFIRRCIITRIDLDKNYRSIVKHLQQENEDVMVKTITIIIIYNCVGIRIASPTKTLSVTPQPVPKSKDLGYAFSLNDG